MLIEEFKLLENELINKVLYFALSPDYSAEIDRAKNLFTKMLRENKYSCDEKNFTSWLLWEYKLEKNKKNFFREYIQTYINKLPDKHYKILEGLSNSYLSIYENVLTNGKRKLRDIFLKKEFEIEDNKDTVNINELLIGRISSYHDMNYLLDDYLTVDRRFRNGIEKIFHEKYEEYKNKNNFHSIEQFVNNNPILLYSFAYIIDDITKKQIENNTEYNVFQSNYIVMNYKEIYDTCINSDKIELNYEENSTIYFIMYEQNKRRAIGEIVLSKNKLELECTSEIDMITAKGVLEKLASNFIKHIKDEIFTIDDIL